MARARAARILLLGLAACVLAVAAAGAWILHTEAGLQWLVARAVGLAGGRLQIHGAVGTLTAGARAREVVFATEGLSVRVEEARFALSPWSLASLSPRIENPGAVRVEIRTRPGDDPLPDSIALPLDVAVRNARIDLLVIDHTTQVFELRNVHLEYAGGKRSHRIEALDFVLAGHAVALRATVDAHEPFALRAHVAVVRPTGPKATIAATLDGDLSLLRIDAHGGSGQGTANAVAAVRPNDPQPIDRLELAVRDFDPGAIDPALPHAQLSGDLALARRGDRLQGPVKLRNAAPGPIDRNRVPLVRLEADVLSVWPAAAFSRLHADLGAAGAIAGSGRVEGEAATLALTLKDVDLHAFHSALRQTRLAGAATFELAASTQSVKAELSQDDIRLALAANRTGDDIAIHTLDARARGGSISGQGRIALGGRKPFALQALLSGFDPAAWGDFPQGTINASLRAEGHAQEPSARIELALRDSRWLGAPLTGGGLVEGSAERIAQADVQLALGANRLSAKGAFGGAGDALALTFDATQPELIEPQLRGRVRGTAVVSGTFAEPDVKLDANAADLRHALYGAVDAMQIAGHAGLAPDAPLDVQAVLSGVRTPQIALRSVRLDVRGQRSRHEGSLAAAGEPVDLQLRVAGALSPDGVWTGTVRELANRGELPIELKQPVALTIARNRLHAEPFELDAAGGRLSVEALDYDQERLRTAGSLHALPVARLIELIDKGTPVKGSLRLSGRWDLATSPQLKGTVRIARESGDLALGAVAPIELGLQTFTATADIDPARIELEASAELALARASASGRIGAVGGSQAIPYSAASPLQFTATLDVARLAPFASFVDTAMILHGEAHARLQGSGTLGEPRITGSVTARNVGVVLPADGVTLKDGTLDASITSQDIRIESFSIRGGDGVLSARGTLARAGFDRAAIDWRADRFTALGRPDRKLVVSGEGSASLQDKRVTAKGRMRVEEGAFEIGESALPTLSSDVVIVGRERPGVERQTRTFEHLALELILDLGNRVRITGHGLSARLAGELRIFTGQDGRLQASGTVRAREGTFVAYGQRLEIERGNIYFNGPLDDPGLDIVAMRKRQAVEAGVALTGTLQTPLARVVSDPPLPEGEALSWLVLGRSPNEAGTGELSALPLASNLLLGKAANPLKDALKLDELGLRGGAAGEQLLTLGKRLTNRLYLVLEQGFGTAETVLRLEYTLTRRIALRLQAGVPSGGGIFYRRRWN